MKKDFELLKSLGRGTYGKVFQARRRRDGKLCVLKDVPLDGLSTEDKEEALNEAMIMSRCDHFNIIQYFESFNEDNTLFIVMDYAARGDLSQLMRRHRSENKEIEEDLIWNFLIQIAQGIRYLHKNSILHRDLKPQNVFLDEENNVKIGDMGLGKVLGALSCARTGVGTPLYFSPELCKEQPYSFKSDIWSFGCIIYELAALRPPFLAKNQIVLAKKIVNDDSKQIPSSYSSELRFLVGKMLEKDPGLRPSIEQILSYSAVRIRIDRAKLRHKELRLHERYLQLEKQWKEKNATLERENKLLRSQLKEERNKNEIFEKKLSNSVTTRDESYTTEERDHVGEDVRIICDTVVEVDDGDDLVVSGDVLRTPQLMRRREFTTSSNKSRRSVEAVAEMIRRARLRDEKDQQSRNYLGVGNDHIPVPYSAPQLERKAQTRRTENISGKNLNEEYFKKIEHES